MGNVTEVKIFIVTIIDSGVLIAVQPCGTFDGAEMFVAEYFNDPDEMAKYGCTLVRLPGDMMWAWINKQPTLLVTITESVLRIH
jgi:hypothetical protein